MCTKVRFPGTLLAILKETGARIGESLKLKWINVDLKRNTIIINDPEKGCNPRIIEVSSKLISMVGKLPEKSERIFNSSKQSIYTCFQRQRKRLAFKLNNPRLLRISFHTFRHWHATMEYHKTKDIIHVKQRLGHKNVENTMIYVTIEQSAFQTESDEFTSKVAHDADEACELIETGFEYIGNIHGAEIFRKRK